MPQERYVIIGNSAAGLNAAEAIREIDGEGEITLISAEDTLAYSRVATPYFISGEIGDRTLFFKDAQFYRDLNITPLLGKRVTAVEPAQNRVVLNDGTGIPYTKLLIGTGSTHQIPPIQGVDRVEFFPHWTLEEARRIKEKAAAVREVVVLGGGFISMLTINAMHKCNREIRFTVVELMDQVMPRLLDRQAAQMLEEQMRQQGIEVRTGAEAVELAELPGGRKRVTLKDGSLLEADMIVMATGVRPNIDFLQGSGIAVQRGVLVDQQMRTSVENIFAAGDCAECADFLHRERTVVHAIWPTAVEQGKVAGANMAGKRLEYPGSLSMNVLDAFGMTFTSIGLFQEEAGVEMLSFTDPERRIYRKLALKDGRRIVGLIAAGGAEEVRYMGAVQS
ncbi:MAG: NAD(P)/FAD-dependent oxidoreductase, partial [Nitrospinota bacterium]